MKLLKVCKISLSVFSCALLLSCSGGPKVTLCISSPADGGFACVDHKENESFLKYEESDKYIAVSPEDFRTILEYAKVRCQR